MEKCEPVYLGDGVYATEVEGGTIRLTTGSHERAHADNVIELDPEVIAKLLKYIGRVEKRGQ